MAEGIPDLIIPIRLEPGAATAQLSKLGGAGKKGGDDVASGAKKGQSGLARLASGAGDATHALLQLTRQNIAFNIIKQSAGAIADEFKKSADHIKEMASEFAALRRTMQEIATLKGSGNNDEFTLEQARAGQNFNLRAAEQRDFQAEFLNYAGSQVGTDEATGKISEGAKLTAAQGEEYGSRVAALMKESGIKPAIGAELAGALLENSKGPQDVDALMAKLSRTFNVLEKGRVPLDRALPQLTQIMGHGIESEEAARMFSIVAPVSPGEEGIAVESALKAIEEMKAKGTGADFGVKQGMSQYESVKAFAENINERKRKLMAQGDTEQLAIDKISAVLEQKQVAADVRERRGLVRGFGGQGVEYGGFARYEKIERETPEDFETARRSRYEASDMGRREKAELDTEVARLEKEAEHQTIDLEMEKARGQLTKKGAFTNHEYGDAARNYLAPAAYTGVTAEQQKINERVSFEGARKLAESGGSTTDRYFGQGEEAGDRTRAKSFTAFGSQGEVDAELKAIFREIADNTKRREEERERSPGKPIAAPPPPSVRNAGG